MIYIYMYMYMYMYIMRMNIIEHHYQGLKWDAKIRYWEYTIMEYVSNIVFGSLQNWWMLKQNAPSQAIFMEKMMTQ